MSTAENDPLAQLADQVGRLTELTRDSLDVMMVLDLECRIRFINWTVPGLTVEQVLGRAVFEFVPAQQHTVMRDCFEQVQLTGAPGSYANVYEVPGAQPLYWESRVAPIRAGEGIIGFTVFSRDISERVARSRELDDFFELSIDFMAIAGIDGYFKRINKTFVDALGYDEATLTGTPYAEFIHPEDVEPTRLAVAEVIDGRDVIGFENRYRNHDGSYRRLSWKGRLSPDGTTLLTIARDVTQQHALENQLRESQKMEAVGRLAGGIAHDFNNLMLAVLANAEFATEELNEHQSEARSHLEEVTKAGQRAAQLTRQLLTFARQSPFEIKPVDVNALTRDLLKMLRRLIPEDVEVAFVGALELPAVAGDAAQIEQVLMNLCVNARDAMPAGGRLTIATELIDTTRTAAPRPLASASPKFVRLSVSDTGDGIPVELQGRVFEPFFTTKAPGKGTGLGLSTAYAIVQRHKGMLTVHSVPGEGATFQAYLPISDDLAAQHPPPQAKLQQQGAGTILVVEDDAAVRKLVAKILTRAGYQVLTAGNGQEAIELAHANDWRIDLAVLDVVMPEMSGPEVFKRLQQSLPKLPVVFTSGYSDSTRHASLLPRGARILGKPYKDEELLSHVREALTPQ